MVGIGALELGVEEADLESGGVHRTVGCESVVVSLEGYLPGQKPEYPVAAPGGNVQIVHDRVALPVPLADQVQRLASEVGPERRDGMDRQTENGQVASGGGVEDPSGLIGWCPVDLGLQIETQRIVGLHLAGAVEARVAHLHTDFEEADLAIAGDARGVQVVCFEVGSVEDGEFHTCNARMIRQCGRKTGVDGIGGRLRRLISTVTDSMEAPLVRIVCSSSGISSTRA